jgi:hypothetical protein
MTHGRMLSSPFGPSQPCAAGTMAAADFSLRLVYSVTRRLPFRSETRSPQVSPLTVPARAPDLRNGPLVARASRSIARSLWSAPPSIRFLFVAPRVSLAASFGVSLTIHALRFARVAATNSPEDFHLQVSVHAGHTTKKGPGSRTPFGFTSSPWFVPWSSSSSARPGVSLSSSAPLGVLPFSSARLAEVSASLARPRVLPSWVPILP